MAGMLDQLRASNLTLRSASGVTVGDEPLVIDLVPASSQLARKHWIVEAVTCLAQCSLRGPGLQGGPPVSGLYLCAPESPVETLAESQAGWNRVARTFLLPACVHVVALGAGTPLAVSVSLDAGYKIAVPALWFLRVIIVAQAGTATPGPGAGSTGTLQALVTEESDCR